ncbi:MAG: biopolymer transporter ExbD [Alphaproteobacteria bacterium]|nr:biopolymer transporter ExbD [Alphaproteobacteria bacterium]
MEFKRNTRKLRAISMVSLIDIVFTIILFFLVAGHMEKFSIVPVELPRADSGQRLQEGPVVVSLGRYGEVIINDELYEGGAIADVLTREFAINPERVVTIKADAHLAANSLVDFLEQIRAAGGKNLSLVTDAGPMAVGP